MLHIADLACLPEERLELQAIEAESIGWTPLGHGVYLHQGAAADDAADNVIEVVGIPGAHMASINVVWLI